MSRYYLLDAARQPVAINDLIGWAAWYELNPEARRVAESEPAPGVRVSTVFLGINHSFHPDNEPQLFETMVFGGPLDQEQQRHATWAEAEAGHRAMVERVEAFTGLGVKA